MSVLAEAFQDVLPALSGLCWDYLQGFAGLRTLHQKLTTEALIQISSSQFSTPEVWEMLVRRGC